MITGRFVLLEKPLTSSQPLKGLRFIAIALLVLAICFRFSDLDRKVYWHDEAYTSMAITARPGKYFYNNLFQNKIVRPADLLEYQRFVPGLNLTDMIVRKGTEDVQHPPVYYLLLRFWTQIWGTAPAVTRGFSSLLSLLLFPALYWLCLELFESHLTGWIAIALFSVSPFHLVYAQEARQFGFWTVLTVASSALLLRAMRSSSWRNWALYGVSMLVAFYTGLFSFCVAVGHFAYVFLMDVERHPLRIGKRSLFCGITLLLVAVLFTPWMYFLITAQDMLNQTTAWTGMSAPLLTQIQTNIFNFSRSFVDFNFDFSNSFAYVIAIPILLLQAYAMVVLCRTAPKKVWLFIATFVGSTALILGLPDLLFGGQRFTVPRYPIPCYVGLQLAVAYLISHALSWQPRIAKLGFSLLIVLGVVSCGVYTQSNTWWNKQLSSNYHQLASVINGSDRALILLESNSYYPVSSVSLSYLLKPETQFLLLPPLRQSAAIPALPEDVRTVFLFNLPEAVRQELKARYQKDFTLAFQDPWNEVWQVNLPLHTPQSTQLSKRSEN
jgi:uncharacterized membrane protein